MGPNIDHKIMEYSILYKDYNLTRFNHQKNLTHMEPRASVKEVS